MNHDLADLVGNADIAERCGVGRPAVSNWIKRYSDFPTPLLTICAYGPGLRFKNGSPIIYSQPKREDH